MPRQLSMSSPMVEFQAQGAHGIPEPVPPSPACGVSMGTLGGTVNVQVPESPKTLNTFFEPETADASEIGWYVGAEPDPGGVVYSDSNIYRLVVSVADASASAIYRVTVSDSGGAVHRMIYDSGAHYSDLIVVNQSSASARTTSIVVYSRSGGSWVEFFSGDVLISALTADSQGVRELAIPGP